MHKEQDRPEQVVDLVEMSWSSELRSASGRSLWP